MDLVTQTSLEALLLKATSSQNQNIDAAAVEAFCTLINKEKDGAHIGVKIIANRLHSGVEKEVLQTLNILDICMSRCGTQFQSEVGKFRFLNEMIKLVSPKYLGSHTPLTVRQKVLNLMYIWTLDYPKESKIKEAYDMLRKQGVIREIPNPNVGLDVSLAKRKQHNSIFHDEEKSKILQKLLQSKDPEDIQAANWLIKSMVKEDDKRAEMKSKRIIELESVQNNVRLLNEMLDSYKPGYSSADELDLIKELHQSCERYKPTVLKIASETQNSEEMLNDVLQISDELGQVFSKFNTVIIEGGKISQKDEIKALLDFESSSDNGSNNSEAASNSIQEVDGGSSKKTDMDVLCDIFTATNIPVSTEVLVPTTVLSCDKPEKSDVGKLKALEELDILGEHLLKENLQSVKKHSFKNEKVPMNQLSNKTQTDLTDCLNFDLNYLINKKPIVEETTNMITTKTLLLNANKTNNESANSDDCLVDITNDEKMLQSSLSDTDNDNNTNNTINDSSSATIELTTTSSKNNVIIMNNKEKAAKLNDVFVTLESVKPSGFPPITLLDDKNGITISLHYAKDKPKEGVHVYVVTVVNKNELPLDNYLFQAVVPKGCKLKLQPPSATDLPVYNPFLPPSAITQIILISNPESVQTSLKFIVSYCMDDETITEMGEVDCLPVN